MWGKCTIITPILKLGEESRHVACRGPGGESVAVLPSPTGSSGFPARSENTAVAWQPPCSEMKASWFLKHFDERRKVRNSLRLFLEKVSGLRENFRGEEWERGWWWSNCWYERLGREGSRQTRGGKWVNREGKFSWERPRGEKRRQQERKEQWEGDEEGEKKSSANMHGGIWKLLL